MECKDCFTTNFLFSRDKKGTLDGEIFDLLYTLTDFMAFKEMFLEYKNYKDGRYIDLATSISVTSYKFDSNDEGDEEEVLL